LSAVVGLSVVVHLNLVDLSSDVRLSNGSNSWDFRSGTEVVIVRHLHSSGIFLVFFSCFDMLLFVT